ncbi:TOM1-like protein 2 [Cryptotermes secundus]|uniref:TOM1-like protein 2 n=1 Tax=Cryptotermes secundus TaxID=105785 RepID=A0A2J7PJK9_9NEOP|nr:TOM1-like protein 2 isoform X2 [Cryptotermes secundus]PNF16526.1 TOM1-like protein 2 [Cryptotermes secundus]
MSFFGGNPFASPVGQRIEQATDAALASENWALNMEICDIINDTEDGPKDAIKAIRKRLTQNAGKNYTVVMYTLTVLETCVKNCGKRFHILACNKEFVQELVKLIGPKNDPPTAVQEKVLSLIQSWADAFRHQTELSGVVQVYHDLKQKGIEFPMTDLDTMAPIHTPQRSIPDADVTLGVSSLQTHMPASPTPVVSPHAIPPGSPATQPVTPASQIGPTVLSFDQLGKLQSELDVVQGNMVVLSEMLTELTPGEEHPSDLELLKELHSTCQAMQHRLVELIGKLANDEITAELLRVNDELNNLFLRYNRFENNREASLQTVKAPAAQVVTATQKLAVEAGADALIDLSDEAAPSVTSRGVADGPNLNTKFAGLSLGSGNATAQLSMISCVPAQHGSQQKEKEDTEFDMFAQSRNVTYESSKAGGSTYQDNLEPDQLNAALGAIAQNRTQAVMHKESDFDEMAAWLDDKPESGGAVTVPEESLTSSEFERFLAERAAAAEALPSVTAGSAVSTTTTTTTSSSSSASRSHHRQLNKEADSESSLFAL